MAWPLYLSSNPAWQKDLESTLCHELGHAACLQHHGERELVVEAFHEMRNGETAGGIREGISR